MTSTLSALPDERYITMKLLYYDERTPKDYEPSFFKCCTDDPLTFPDKPVKVNVGSMNTPYHGLSFKVKTTSDSSTVGKSHSNSERIKKMQWCVEDSESEEEKEKAKDKSVSKEKEQVPKKTVVSEKETPKGKVIVQREEEKSKSRNTKPSAIENSDSTTEDEHGNAARRVTDHSGYHSPEEVEDDISESLWNL